MAMMEEEHAGEEHFMEEEAQQEDEGMQGPLLIDQLEGQAGISAGDVKKLREASYYTVSSVRACSLHSTRSNPFMQLKPPPPPPIFCADRAHDVEEALRGEARRRCA